MPDEAVLRIITVDDSSGQATASGGSSGGSAPLGMPPSLPPLPSPVSPRGHHGPPGGAGGSNTHHQSSASRKAQQQAERAKREAERLAKRAQRDAERAASKATNESKRKAAKSQREADVAAKKSQRAAERAAAAAENDRQSKSQSALDSIKKLTGVDVGKILGIGDLFKQMRGPAQLPALPAPVSVNANQPGAPAGPNVAPTQTPVSPMGLPMPPMGGGAGGSAAAAGGAAGALAAVAVPLALAAAATAAAFFAAKGAGGAVRTPIDAATKAVNQDHLGAAADMADAGFTAMQIVGGPVGLVFGEIGKQGTKTIKALDELASAFIKRGKELSTYSGTLAMADARQEIRDILADMREANANGQSYAELMDAVGELRDMVREGLLPIKAFVANLLTGTIQNLQSVLEMVSQWMPEIMTLTTAGLNGLGTLPLIGPAFLAMSTALTGIYNLIRNLTTAPDADADEMFNRFINDINAAGQYTPPRDADPIVDANSPMYLPI